MEYKELHYLLLISGNYSNKMIVKLTSRLGLLPGQPKILEYLSVYGTCTPKEIAEGCALDKSTITSLLHGLEKAQYIRREIQKKDKRSFLLQLTPKGEETAKEVREICGAVDTIAWNNIDDDERAGFTKTMQKIICNLKMGE